MAINQRVSFRGSKKQHRCSSTSNLALPHIQASTHPTWHIQPGTKGLEQRCGRLASPSSATCGMGVCAHCARHRVHRQRRQRRPLCRDYPWAVAAGCWPSAHHADRQLPLAHEPAKPDRHQRSQGEHDYTGGSQGRCGYTLCGYTGGHNKANPHQLGTCAVRLGGPSNRTDIDQRSQGGSYYADLLGPMLAHGKKYYSPARWGGYVSL